MQPFTIQCTTCRRSLRVASPAAIGQILACPKCSGFILIEAPAGWDTAPSASDVTSASLVTSSSLGVAPVSLSGSNVAASVPAPVAPVPVAPLPPVEATAKPAALATAPAVAAAPNPFMPKSGSWKDPPIDFLPGNESTPPTATRPTEIASAEPATASANSWPRWFWPGVAATVGAAVLVLVVRVMLHDGSGTPPETALQVAVTQPTAVRPNESAPAIAVDPTNQPRPAITNKPVIDEPPATLPESTPTAQAANDQPLPTTNDVAPSNIASPLPTSPPAVPAATDVAVSQRTEDTQPAATQPTNAPRITLAPPLPAPPAATNNSNVGSPQNFAAPNNTNIAETTTAADDPVTEASEAEPPATPAHTLANQPASRTLQSSPPRVFDVKAKLLETIPGLSVKNISLADYLSLVSDLSTVPISLDGDALLEMGRTPNVAVQVKTDSASIADVLNAALQPLKLGSQAEAGQLIVGYPMPGNLRTANYAVADLVGDDPQALADLAALAQKLVAPQTWKQAGGQGTLTLKTGALAVQQNDSVHNQLIVFCEKLRIARGLPQKSKFDPARFLLTTRREKAKALLNHPVTANFGVPEQLADVVKWLHQTTGATFLIDHAALAQDETSAESECTIVAAKKPLAKMLDELLNPIGLAWRALDEHTIEITTGRAAAARFELEFHPARELNTNSAEALAAQIKSQIEPALWTSQPAQAIFHFDAPSRTFIIRAPQPVQTQIEGFLTAARKQ